MATAPSDLLLLSRPQAMALRNGLPVPRDARSQAQRAAAFSDPARLRIAVALAQGQELCVSDLSWIAKIPVGSVSHHLKILRGQGFVESRRNHRLAIYSISADAKSVLREVRRV